MTISTTGRALHSGLISNDGFFITLYEFFLLNHSHVHGIEMQNLHSIRPVVIYGIKNTKKY